jgi:lipoprotein-anchoring transpeptidase ErfK/SrfK
VRRVLVVAVGLTLLLVGCGGGSDRPSLARHATSAPRPCTAPLFASPVNCVARPVGPTLRVYASPTAANPSWTFPNPWLLNNDPKLQVPEVLLVAGRSGSWVKVLLPIRPNGTAGWVRTQDVVLSENPYRITVELGAHRLTVYNGAGAVVTDTVAVGEPSTPTPTGTYYLRVLLKAPDPTTVYGPYAYGLSGHSNALTTFDGGDAELGIHGNNDPSVLGKDISHGCIRMSNDKITYLAGVLPLGTPVQISA